MRNMAVQNTETKKQIPKFSIIIAVTHSIKCLEDCLKSLEGLNYPKELFQVVLVDCHVIPGLANFFKENTGTGKINITALTLPEQLSAKKSWLHEARLNEARNLAMQRVPGRYFVFTEDDCMFEPDWLKKFDPVLDDVTLGAAGGPDILPEGMGWLPRALDCILNSFAGTAGAKRGDGPRNEWYYPRKENTVIPARVFERIGNFPQEMIFGAEMEMAKRIRDAGLVISYLPDNPVWHWRDTTFMNLVRRNIYHAAEKVRLLRRQRLFLQSPHFLVFLAAASCLFLGLLSLVNGNARAFFVALILLYLLLVFFLAIKSLVQTRSLAVSLGVLLLLPSHHASILTGVLKGMLFRV